jgi:hypothetical protein
MAVQHFLQIPVAPNWTSVGLSSSETEPLAGTQVAVEQVLAN